MRRSQFGFYNAPVIWLAVIACVVAAVALFIALGNRAATKQLALEMVQLRDKIARLHGEQDAQRERAEAEIADQAARVTSSIAPRIDAIEKRTRDLMERGVPMGRSSSPQTSLDAGEIVRRHMRAQGYECVVLLDIEDDGSVLVEAERDGISAKGVAHVTDEGEVDLRAISSLRAFP